MLGADCCWRRREGGSLGGRKGVEDRGEGERAHGEGEQRPPGVTTAAGGCQDLTKQAQI